MFPSKLLGCGLTVLGPLSTLGFAQLTVVDVTPPRHTRAAVDADIVVSFDRAVDAAALPPAGATFGVFGSNSGVITGSFSLENAGFDVRFDPDANFMAGEVVSVQLSEDLAAMDGSNLRTEGYTFRFRAIVAPSMASLELVQTQSARTNPNTLVRVYGGQGCDFDGDGWPDFAAVNEVASDVRVFQNTADGSGWLADFTTPTHSVDSTPSPNEVADFDGDGLVDMVTGSTGSSTVSILFGNGDGTFDPRQDVPVGGSTPRGVAVLDFDGDGDADLAAAVSGIGQVSLLENDGSGQFSVLSTFDGGGSGEFGLASGDMNEDGIADLVVGLQTSQRLSVLLGNGDGTFSQGDTLDNVGRTWMIVLGDLNGDGHVDVTTANGSSGSGSIVLGDGAGGLGAPVSHSTGSFTTATDVGDLDGDGDLDWIISDFGGGRWTRFENDGSGSFTNVQSWQADNSPACAVLIDMDRDGDLDVFLLDELADTIKLLENGMPGETLCFGDGSGPTACGCGNESVAGANQNCLNSTGQGGVLLASGSASVSADDLVLHAQNMRPNNFGLIFSGTVETNVPFGDGLRCLDGALFRYPVFFTGVGGTFDQSNLASIGSIAAGETRLFQGWFRDPSGPCGVTYTGTSAIRVVFVP